MLQKSLTIKTIHKGGLFPLSIFYLHTNSAYAWEKQVILIDQYENTLNERIS